MEKQWIEYQQIDFAGNYAWINIDTRDFHGIVINDRDQLLMDLPQNYRENADKYFHTPEEVKALLDRYYTESGGKGEWRMLTLDGADEQSGWDLKYIAIVNHRRGLLICKRAGKDRIRPLKKTTLNLPVRQKHLNHIKD